jgi:undecaprenyl-diphosphatase
MASSGSTDPTAAESPAPASASASASTSTSSGGLTGARPWSRHGIELAVGAALLLLSWALLDESRHVVPGWETDLFHAVNDLPDALRWPIWPFMQLGNFWMIFLGAAIAYAITKRWQAAAAVAVAVLLAWITAKVVKGAIERGRPADLLDDVHVRESGLDGWGYVSGHAAIAFAVATVLTPLLPGRWRYVPFTLAAIVGFARVYYGAHLPLDALGGAGLGILCGLLASLVFGTVRPRPPARAA